MPFLHNINNLLFRAFMAFSGIFKPPFYEDLLPIPNDEGICGIANDGGRWNKDEGVALMTDQIPDETRAIEPDRCVTNDDVGGGVVLDSSLTLTKWAVGFDIENNDHSGYSYIVGRFNERRQSILFHLSDYLSFRDSSFTFHNWDGTGNTILTDCDIASINVFMYNDGVNIHAYINGEYKGYLPSSDDLIVDSFVSNYLPSSAKGNHFHYRIYDCTTRTAQQINDYMAINGCLWAVGNMKEDPKFTYRQWLLNEKGSSTAFDSGSDKGGFVSDGSGYLEFDDLTGITITSYRGTATASISGDTINVTSGYIKDLELSNGDFYPLRQDYNKI